MRQTTYVLALLVIFVGCAHTPPPAQPVFPTTTSSDPVNSAPEVSLIPEVPREEKGCEQYYYQYEVRMSDGSTRYPVVIACSKDVANTKAAKFCISTTSGAVVKLCRAEEDPIADPPEGSCSVAGENLCR